MTINPEQRGEPLQQHGNSGYPHRKPQAGGIANPCYDPGAV